jgi:hypothetical protein
LIASISGTSPVIEARNEKSYQVSYRQCAGRGWGGMNTDMPAHEAELDQVMMSVAKNWIEIAAVASHSHRAYGRGVVQLSNTGDPESYVLEEQITDKQRKTAVMAYNPLTTVLVLCPVAEGNIFGEFTSQPTPSEASTIHKLQRTRKDGLYHSTNSTRLIRIADVKYYESILQVALEITEKLDSTITMPYRRDVLQLAIRLIAQSQTLYYLGSPSVSLAPRLGGRNPIVDISSIASIFRTIIETYLTMHEVFFEPKDDNDFDFFHSRWMLIGIHNVRKHTPADVYKVFAPETVEPLRVDAAKRMKNTTQYQAMLSRKKNNPRKTMEALIHRNREPAEWQRIAQSANISAADYQKMYSAFSGYIHSDGYTSFKLHQQDAAECDSIVEFLLYLVTGIVSKMICDFTERYEDADHIAKTNNFLYQGIKKFSKSLSDG